jgi:hypothetical protein
MAPGAASVTDVYNLRPPQVIGALGSHRFTLDNKFYRECRCEYGFGDPFYPNPGPIAPLRAREEIVSDGGDSPRQRFLSCFQSNICTDVV